MAHSDLEKEENLSGTRLNRAMLGRCLTLLAPMHRFVVLAIIAEMILVASVFFRPWFMKVVIDDGIEGDGTIHSDILWWYGGGLLATWVIRFVAFGISRYASGMVAIRVLNDLRISVFAHVQHLSVRYFDQTRAGRIVSRADRDVDSLEPMLVEGPPMVLSILMRFLGSSVLLYIINPKILSVLLLLAPFMWICMAIYKRIGTRLWAAISEAKSQVTTHLVESINGVSVIKQSVAEDNQMDEYKGFLTNLYTQEVKASFGWGWFMPVLILFFYAGLSAVLWQGAWAVSVYQEMTPGDMAQCVFYVFLFLGPLADIGMLYERISQGFAAAQRIFLLLDTHAEVVDKDDAKILETVHGDIEFNEVSFAYDPDEQEDFVIKNVSLSIPAGQTLAIVGQTGHGKSTLIQILARFYDIQNGVISLDGYDVSQCSQKSLRQHIGIVLQDSLLFSGSIIDNIRMAKPDADQNEIIAACQHLGADEVFERLPDQYNTEVGPRGSQISAGQRQLVCLVRAFIADPAVLVLDEATSSMDVYTENRVQKALLRLCHGRTALIIAHRLSTIQEADRIIVIENGLIIESGTHADLVQAGKHYADLYASYKQ